jgi:polysaccharide export outer membrane protein
MKNRLAFDCRPAFLRFSAGMLVAVALAGCSSLPWPAALRSSATPTGAVPEATDAIGVADPGYEIGPEDALNIAVWKDEALKSDVLVRPDGGISFPLVGDLHAAGKTAAQLRDEIVKRLQKYMPDPVVTVSVVKVASYRIYVLGRVNKPGDFPVGRSVDVLQALSMAGGMTPFAAEADIRIIRRVGDAKVAIPFDYSQVRRGEGLAQNITLKSGDVVLVP